MNAPVRDRETDASDNERPPDWWHREHPTFGVQFHPESFRTPHGPLLLANFLREVPDRACGAA